MIKKLLHKITGGSEADKKILIRSGYTFIINIGGYILAFLVMILLTRTLGAKQYGAYSYAMSWVTFLSVIALVGFDKLLVRELSKQKATGNIGLIRGIYRWSNNIIIVTSILIATLGYLLSYYDFEIFKDSVTRLSFRYSMFAVPLFALSMQRQASLQGIKEVVLAQLPEKVIRPAVLAIFITIGLYFIEEWTAVEAIIFGCFAFCISFIIGQIIYSQKTKNFSLTMPEKALKKDLKRSMVSFLLFTGVSVISVRIDIFMLGGLQGSTEKIGIYNVALRMTELINFFLVAFNLVLAPTISELFTQGKHKELQNTLIRSSRIILTLSLPVILVIALLRNWYLPYFGDGFTAASFPILLLTGAQFISVASGSVGYLLLMTRNEKFALYTLISSTIINIVLNTILIPIYGIKGAAIATAVSIVLNNIIMLIIVYRKLHINPTAFGKVQA